MRTILYRFPDLESLGAALRAADEELEVPAGDGQAVAEGEWVVALFEVGPRPRATACAARGLDRGDGVTVLSFEPRDWERLALFSEGPVPRQSGANLRASGSRRKDEGEDIVALHVDDDDAVRSIVAATLAGGGVEVIGVASGEEAMATLSAQRVDVLIVDWHLPRMSGIELCLHLRQDGRFAFLPIVFLTCQSSTREILEAFACGADDFVAKPFRATELRARVSGLLRRAKLAGGACG